MYTKRDFVSSAAIFNKDIVIKYGSVNKGSSKSRRTKGPLVHLRLHHHHHHNFLKLHFHIYKLNIQIQISLMLGNLHSAGLSTEISTHQANKRKK